MQLFVKRRTQTELDFNSFGHHHVSWHGPQPQVTRQRQTGVDEWIRKKA